MMDTAKTVAADRQLASAQHEQNPPKTVGSGFVTSVLGEGGAAIVYEIWNPKLEIHRAVKLWRPNLSEKDLQRFETEIKITSKLDHPNIVEIHTVGEWNGLPYLEMERIDGYSLQRLLKINGALPPLVTASITYFICNALIYAHQEEFSLYGRKRKGVIHCDVKPANIIITKNGLVKIMDFGIANPTNVSLHAEPDKLTGSLQYMAPEQIRSRQVDACTDIFSLGVVLYEMFGGKKAFPSRQLLEALEKRKLNEYTPLNQIAPVLPKRVYKLVAMCMELQPEDRFQSALELQQELSALIRRHTSIDPQSIIQQYMEHGTVTMQKVHVSRQVLIPVIAGAVPTILLIIAFLFILNRNETPVPVAAVAISTEAQSKQVQGAVPEPSEEVSRPATQSSESEKTVEPVPPEPLASVLSPEPTVKKVVRADPLRELERLVENGQLQAALRKLEAKPINDGAYFALYARCLYGYGRWQEAAAMAKKSTLVASIRSSKAERSGLTLLYNAKYQSTLFDDAPSRDVAQAAVTAWWAVRDFFDGSSKALFAESEINRIGAFLRH